MKSTSTRSFIVGAACALASFLTAQQAWCSATVYVQTNLVSDIPGLAQSTDPNLKNPWGVSFSATSPFWVSNAGSNTSTLYQGTGSTINARVVGVSGGPTGTVQNSTTGFIEANGKAASFIFSTLSGSIYSWNSSDVAAQQVSTVPLASFTGLAFANNGSANYLYASSIGTPQVSPFGVPLNPRGAGIVVFDTNFAVAKLSGSFTDPSLPAGYLPYNIQAINGQLYVEYANFNLGLGAVSIFDANGNFIKELITAGGPNLNEPWGVVIAPAGFGSFANDLLVGNLGNGQINAFDPTSGAFLGTLSSFSGPIVNSGLWSLSVRTGGTFDVNAVYFMAGINGQLDGLFGKLNAVAASALAITTASQLPAGKIGTVYTQTLAATGGVPSYKWSVTGGSLPAGLSLNATTGVISGTPTVVSGNFYGTITVTDSAGTTSASPFQLTIQPASTATLSRVGSFAQVTSGGGWTTSMTLINTSGATVNAQVNLYMDTGSPMSASLTFPQFGSSLTTQSVSLTLTPNDSVVIVSNAPISAGGWADVQATGALSGYATFAFVPSPGAPDVEGTVPLDTRLSSSLLLPYDNTNGYQTALALANQSAVAQTLTATLVDQNGNQLATAQIALPAWGHSSFFLSSKFAQSANQLGTIQFQSSGGITGFGLHFGPTGSFTSLPIIR